MTFIKEGDEISISGTKEGDKTSGARTGIGNDEVIFLVISKGVPLGQSAAVYRITWLMHKSFILSFKQNSALACMLFWLRQDTKFAFCRVQQLSSLQHLPLFYLFVALEES